MAKTNSAIRFYGKKMKNDGIEFFLVSRAGSAKFLSFGQKLSFRLVKKKVKNDIENDVFGLGICPGRENITFFI